MEFIDLKAQYQHLKTAIHKALNEVMSTCNFIMGSEVVELEKQLANYAGVSHCISCANGTDALQMALMALNIQAGDEVITSPLSYISSADAVSLLGATPVFADIHPDTFNLNPSCVEKKITSKTKAIIPVSLFGQMPDMEAFLDIAKRYNLFLIEDGAQSFGATYKNKRSGSIFDIGTTSFFPAKPLGCSGDGGAIFTSHDHIAEKLKAIRLHGGKRHDYRIQGINSRLDTLQAAILKVKLAAYPKELQDRQRLAKYYDQNLPPTFIKPFIHKDCSSVYALYTIKTPEDQREELLAYLKEKNIPCGIYYPKLIPHQLMYKHLTSYSEAFPYAEQVSKQVLSLPFHPYLSKEDQERVLEELHHFCGELVR